MLVKGYKIQLPRWFWIIFVPLFLLRSYSYLFLETNFRYSQFNQLEDFGEYIFLLVISFAEAFIYTGIIWLLLLLTKKLLLKIRILR